MDHRLKFTNFEALQQLKQLINSTNRRSIINRAFNIYHSIDGKKNHHSINALLRVLTLYAPQHILHISNDITNSNNNNISPQLLIKCCISALEKNPIDNLKQYIQILDHATINTKDDIVIKTALINAYGLCSNTQKATKIYNSISNEERDDICIGAMMKCHLQNNEYDAVILLHQHNKSMHNDILHNLAIKACINGNRFEQGKYIIDEDINCNFTDLYGENTLSIELLNTMISFYGCFNDMKHAKQIFHSIPRKKKDIVTITAMMKCCINNNENHLAISLYRKMDKSKCDDILHVIAIKAFMNAFDYQDGKRIIENNINLHEYHSVELKNALIDFYGTFGDIDKAFNIFRLIPINKRDTVSIGAMMKCYVNNNYNKKALDLYDTSTHINNDVCHLLAIKACMNMNDLQRGKNIIDSHIDFKRNNHTMSVVNTLIDFYGYFGDVTSAQMLFNSIDGSDKDCVCVGAMLKCFINNGLNEKAIMFYNRMNVKNNITNMLAIKACINTNDFEFGNKIIQEQVDVYEDVNIELLNTLIHFYGHFGDINNAFDVFCNIKNKTIDCVNSMIQAYCNNKQWNAALSMYDEYVVENTMKHDDIFHVLGITACVKSANFSKGDAIIGQIKDMKVRSIELQNAVISFYGEIGSISAAVNTFNSIPLTKKDTITFNAMLNVYYINKLYRDAIELFEELNVNYVHLQPDEISYAVMLKVVSECDISIHFDDKVYNGLKRMKYHFDYNELYDLSIQHNLINVYKKSNLMEIGEEMLNEIDTKRWKRKFKKEVQIVNAVMYIFERTGNVFQHLQYKPTVNDNVKEDLYTD